MLIVADISDNTKKCCSACFTRLTRKIAQLTDGSPPVIKTESVEQAVNSVAWSEEEIEMLRSCLKASGRNWAVISQKLHGAKTTEQCKKFFYNNRKKHQLDKLVTEFKRVSFFSSFFSSCGNCYDIYSRAPNKRVSTLILIIFMVNDNCVSQLTKSKYLGYLRSQDIGKL